MIHTFEKVRQGVYQRRQNSLHSKSQSISSGCCEGRSVTIRTQNLDRSYPAARRDPRLGMVAQADNFLTNKGMLQTDIEGTKVTN